VFQQGSIAGSVWDKGTTLDRGKGYILLYSCTYTGDSLFLSPWCGTPFSSSLPLSTQPVSFIFILLVSIRSFSPWQGFDFVMVSAGLVVPSSVDFNTTNTQSILVSHKNCDTDTNTDSVSILIAILSINEKYVICKAYF
jgi:hypothetical protein